MKDIKNVFVKKSEDNLEIMEKKAKKFINEAVGDTDNNFINLEGRPKKTSSKKDSRVTLYLTDKQKELLEKQADENGLSLSAFILFKALN